MDLPTRRDFFAVGRRSIVTTPGLRINPRVIDIRGSDLNVILGAMSVMNETAVARFASNYRASWVETALGSCLDRVAFDRYQITRKPANPASVTLRLARASVVNGAGTYPQGSRVRTASGTVFATNADAVFGALTTLVDVDATALVSGPTGNVPAGTLTAFLDAPYDANLTVTNPAGAAGGDQQESDPEFKARIYDFFPTIRRGVQGAIEYGARTVPGVAVARATEVVTPDASALPAGFVLLTVADKAGGFSSVMLTAVRDVLLAFRALGIPVIVSGGNVVYEDVIWDLDFEQGVNTQAKQAEVRAVTVAVPQFLRPGAKLLRSSLIAAARAVPGVIVNDSSLLEPAGDIVPVSSTSMIRIRDTDVSFV